MNLELFELEQLVNSHENCELRRCETCNRIKELRKKVGDDKEYKYIVINVETGTRTKFKDKEAATKLIGVSKNVLGSMLKEGHERNGYVADWLNKEKKREPLKKYNYHIFDENGKERVFTKHSDVVKFLGISYRYLYDMIESGISCKGYSVIREEVVN